MQELIDKLEKCNGGEFKYLKMNSTTKIIYDRLNKDCNFDVIIDEALSDNCVVAVE